MYSDRKVNNKHLGQFRHGIKTTTTTHTFTLTRKQEKFIYINLSNKKRQREIKLRGKKEEYVQFSDNNMKDKLINRTKMI